MPLSKSAERAPIHERTIACRGFRRADGLWDIEGHLTDIKAHAFSSPGRGVVLPGEPIHDMWLRLTVDDDLVIQAVEASIDAAPYPVCPAIVPNFQALEGLRIGPGWNREIRSRIGGIAGCTHLAELVGRLGTVCYQTIFPDRRRTEPGGELELAKRLIGTCHAWRADGPVVAEYLPADGEGA